MAIKKKDLYTVLWASCDKLRGGMDASQYKDYILTLLFMKYVTDKFKGVKYADITVPQGGSFDDIIALKGKENIGEGIDRIIEKLAEANALSGIINNAHFNDEVKLGKGQEMVDKLTGLVAIFQRPEFDFKNNKAGGDDILGDAYEYLMRNFATESGKSKGQFYTPAEVSRILAKVVGIDKIVSKDRNYTVYDPACGSGSLLIRAADEAPFEIAIYGQEKDTTTAGLAKMNLVLHNKAAGEIKAANTFSSPQYFEEGTGEKVLKQFDFAVANPPFSLKNWQDGIQEYGRFTGYDGRPPEKNGDLAWLLHILKSLKPTGKAAVILPHGVLFRGNAEASIRAEIIRRGYIKGIIGLPANLFYGTSIPACILVLDKSDASVRKGIFMIDASRDYIKDGNNNRLRERDIYKIVTTFNQQITDDPGYARFVPNDEIMVKNKYNLNIPRYINSGAPKDMQDIYAHLHGGIPARDVDSMNQYWTLFPKLKNTLFSIQGQGYYQLHVKKDAVRDTIYQDAAFSTYAHRIDAAFTAWRQDVDAELRSIDSSIDVKRFIERLSKKLIVQYADINLVDKYDVYEVLLSFWQKVMADDVFLLKYDGYAAGREFEIIRETTQTKKGEENVKIKGWDGKLIPKDLMERTFFAAELDTIRTAENLLYEVQSALDTLVEEQAGEYGIFNDCLQDKNKIDTKAVTAKFKFLKKTDPDGQEYRLIQKYKELYKKWKEQTKEVAALYDALEASVRTRYASLTIKEIKDLLVEKKWYASIFAGIQALYDAASHNMANHVAELAERYQDTLPQLEHNVRMCEAKVRHHLEKMGFTW